MKRQASALLPALLVTAALGPSVASELPLIEGRRALASVNGEPITAEDLRQQVESFHGGVSANPEMVRRPDAEAVLQRIVNAKLIIQEALNIGLDELPEVQSRFERGRNELLKRILAEHAVREIDAVDPAEVEPVYRAAVREVELNSLLFETAEAAQSFRDALGKGGDFATMAGAWIERGDAEGSGKSRFLNPAELLPAVSNALDGLDEGAVAGPIQLGGGFAVIRFVSERFPDDPEVRAEVERSLLQSKRQVRLLEYTDELRKRYSTVDEDLLKSLDMDSGEEALAKALGDERIVAEVRGAEPVTVAELTEALQASFFHGLEGAVGRKHVNEEIPGVLDRLILERATELEAARLGVEQSLTYKNRRQAQEDGVLFDTFVSKVINPEVKIEDEELTSYYSAHLADFSTPAMMRLESIAFSQRKDAQTAIEKLRQGSDFDWMRAHATGQVDPSANVVRFEGEILAYPALPNGVREALEGAAAGDLRFHATPEGPVYVLLVSEVFPATPRALSEVREDILKKIFVEKRQAVLDRWTADLREASEIEIYANKDQLMAAMGLGPAESP
jgi:parvulin-like peptidyl-prolyl isomerase